MHSCPESTTRCRKTFKERMMSDAILKIVQNNSYGIDQNTFFYLLVAFCRNIFDSRNQFWKHWVLEVTFVVVFAQVSL